MERTYDKIFLWLPYIYLWTCSWTTKSFLHLSCETPTMWQVLASKPVLASIPHCEWFLWGGDKSKHPEPSLTAAQNNNPRHQFQHCNTDCIEWEDKQNHLNWAFYRDIPNISLPDQMWMYSGKRIGLGLEIPTGGMTNKLIRALHVRH